MSGNDKFAPLADFNWDAIGKKSQNYSADEKAKMASLYENTLQSVTEHDVIDGTIVAITSKDLLVNIGYKSDGIVPLSEVRYNPEIKVGDKLEVYVESQEDKSGQLILSHKKARALRSWDRVNEALEKEEIIKGFVKCRTKGGLIADVFGIEAFLPGSQIDVKPIRDYDVYVGKIMEFKVVKINKEFKNVVVSPNLKKVKSLKVLLKTLLHMVYSSILEVLTVLSTSLTYHGVVSIIRKKSFNSIQKSML